MEAKMRTKKQILLYLWSGVLDILYGDRVIRQDIVTWREPSQRLSSHIHDHLNQFPELRVLAYFPPHLLRQKRK